MRARRYWPVVPRAVFAGALALLPLAAVARPDYPNVYRGSALAFPQDTGAHPDYRTEWWYVTGWLNDERGIERGFQVTFFRVRTGIGEENASRFAPRQLIVAHAAVADPAEGRLLHGERIERALPPLAGAGEGFTRAWAGTWSIGWDQDHYRTRIASDSFAIDLRLDPPGPPVLNGASGFSQKGGDPAYASYYYSRPQLLAIGTLSVRGNVHSVTGRAWLDHEWSSAVLPPGARGWDWIGINLHDGGSLMAFRMRDEQHSAVWAGGTLTSKEGATRALHPADVEFSGKRQWRSPRTGTEYPVEWEVRIDQRRLRVRPLIDDQELDSRTSTGAVYWEGAVRLLDGEREIGRGYLEMTGYGEPLKM